MTLEGGASPASAASDAQAPGVPWGPAAALVGFLVAIAAITMTTTVVVVLDPGQHSTVGRETGALLAGLGFSLTAFGFALVWAGGRPSHAANLLGLRRDAIGGALLLALLGWLVYAGGSVALSPLLQPDQQEVAGDLAREGQSLATLIVAGVLIVGLAPFAEELFFRGFVFAGLRERSGFWSAALLSGVGWGSLHLPGGDLGVAIQLSLFGVVLAYLYERRGSLLASILAHALNNGLAFALLLADVI